MPRYSLPFPSFDADARRAQMFPKLDDALVARAKTHGERRSYKRGETLWQQGDVNAPCFLVLEGAIEVVHPTRSGSEHVVRHERGEMTGEISQLAGRQSLVTAFAATDLSVIAYSRDELRRMVQTDAELGEIILRAFILRRTALLATGQGDVILVGSQHSADTLRIQEFLARNGHPTDYLDVDVDPNVQDLLDSFHVGVADVPVVVCRNETVLKNPSNAEVAKCLGFNPTLDAEHVRDVVIVGAGPAGLAAAVYAASEGLDALVLETHAPGGQAGSSSKIENYLGFPTGISGSALAARALTQAEKFGADFVVARPVVRLHCETTPYEIELDGGERVKARAVVVATGATYRKLACPTLEKFEGNGVYYGATFVEAQRCGNDSIAIVGGGNSAGQAAVYLARQAKHVYILVRGRGLADTMSRYLTMRIEETANITVLAHTEVVHLEGGDTLEKVTWENNQTKARETHDIKHLFSMTGAEPKTEWLKGCVALDEKGFVLVGAELHGDVLLGAKWPLARAPMLFETSLPAVFAVGDVRSSSVKRVASAVGEGSVCIQLVHRAIATPG